MMEKQQFLNKFEELKSPANAERWAVLQLWLVEAKSDGEIAKALDKDRSTATRKIGEICKHFGTDAKGKKEQRQHLVLLFRRHCKDFEVHPNLYPDWVDGNSSDRPQPPTNPKIIPIPAPIPELTTLEFIGRDRDLTNLANLSRQSKIVLIKSGAGVGKSTLAREFLQTQFKKVIRIEMGLESGNVTPAEEKVSQILRKDFDEEPSRDFGINLDILREKLGDRANPIGVLIDNLEPALDENYRFREKLRGYDALLAVLGDRDVFSFTMITSRRSLITSRARVHEYSLEGLDITAWRQYFHDCENGVDSEALMQMCVAYNGNAKVMDILHGAIKNRFDGNIGAYWSRYKDALLAHSALDTLISVEMDWLQDNQLDAYKLLCRMGCYRYQDIKTVPFEGLLCLLWDVPESRRVGVVEYLSKSSLIEVKDEYYLHPAIRELAKIRLLENKVDWETANQKAATFWIESVEVVDTINDALQAFESYHHYLEINNFTKAGAIIVSHRKNKWHQVLRLGDSFYRLGLLDQILTSINQILSIIENFNDLENKYITRRLYKTKGNVSWAKGDIKKAIECQEKIQISIREDNFSVLFDTNERPDWILEEIKKSEEYQEEIPLRDYLNYYEKRQYVYSLISEGAYKLGLWDMEAAVSLFESATELSFNIMNYTLAAKSQSCLAFVKSSMNLQQEANILADQAYNTLLADEYMRIGGFVWYLRFIAKAYNNLGNLQKSFEIYNQILNVLKTEHSEYSQVIVIANSLTELAELYRMQKDFEKAISHHLESIELLDKIGAKCDLAEAYFQLGLTYQAMGEHDQAEEYKVKALKLFEQMEAPKQIERVNKAFGGTIQ